MRFLVEVEESTTAALAKEVTVMATSLRRLSRQRLALEPRVRVSCLALKMLRLATLVATQ